jgi:8-oxo-dGTP diphosphatase
MPPTRRPKQRTSTTPTQLVAVALLTNRRRVLVSLRTGRDALSGLWEFPGGKVEFGEHPWEALRRELREEIRFRATRGRLFGVYSHVYEFERSRVHVVIVAYRVIAPAGRIRPSMDRVWVPISKLDDWPIVPGSRPIVDDLMRARFI